MTLRDIWQPLDCYEVGERLRSKCGTVTSGYAAGRICRSEDGHVLVAYRTPAMLTFAFDYYSDLTTAWQHYKKRRDRAQTA